MRRANVVVNRAAAAQGLPKGADRFMPSLFRLLIAVAVIGGLGYAVIYALANFVTPTPREMVVTVPADKFLKK